MPDHKSAIKKVRQDKVRYQRNKAYRTQVRKLIIKVKHAIQEDDTDVAQALFTKLVPILDRAVSRNLLHKNNAARMKSRLNTKIKALVQSSK